MISRFVIGLSTASMLCSMPFIPEANASVLKRKTAEAFIARYFPNADIPGSVKGSFSYVDSAGHRRTGHADCHVPAMGEHSEGAVSTCNVVY